MGRVVTVTMQCDRCSSGIHAERVDLEAAIKMKEVAETPEGEPLFLMRTNGSELKYSYLCDGCKDVLKKKLGECGPIKRQRHKRINKKKAKASRANETITTPVTTS